MRNIRLCIDRRVLLYSERVSMYRLYVRVLGPGLVSILVAVSATIYLYNSLDILVLR